MDNLDPMAHFFLLFFLTIHSGSVSAEESAPAAWPRFHAKVSKDQVNFRVEPSVKARLAPARPLKGSELSVQHSADSKWFEILDPDEYRGFFVREDMVILGNQEKDPTPKGR